MGNGFIVTGMLWAAYLIALAVLAFFGIIHSAMPDGTMYLPWNLVGLSKQVPYQFAIAYLVLAVSFFVMSWTKESKEPITGMGH